MVYFKHLRQLWAILQLLWSDLQQEKAVIFFIEYKYRKQGWMWSRFNAASLIYVLRLCVGV